MGNCAACAETGVPYANFFLDACVASSLQWLTRLRRVMRGGNVAGFTRASSARTCHVAVSQCKSVSFAAVFDVRLLFGSAWELMVLVGEPMPDGTDCVPHCQCATARWYGVVRRCVCAGGVLPKPSGTNNNNTCSK